jgi:hypothetical protein
MGDEMAIVGILICLERCRVHEAFDIQVKTVY